MHDLLADGLQHLQFFLSFEIWVACKMGPLQSSATAIYLPYKSTLRSKLMVLMNPSTGRRRVCREDYFPRHKNVQCHQSYNHRSELLWLQDTMFPTGTYYTMRYTELFHQFLTMFSFCLQKPHHVLPADNIWWNAFFLQGSAVAVHDIRYSRIHGTSSSKIAVNFNCSSAVHCDGIVMQDVSLVGKGSYLACSSLNARVIALGFNSPHCSAAM
jgi:hypothetical protein